MTHAANPQVPRRLRILIAEDHVDCRVTFRRLLEVFGHQVEEAANGTEAVARALAWSPEVVFVDIGLPHLDGYEVARQLRACFGDRIFLIAHTGYGSPADIRRGREAGFDAYLVKPFELAELHHWLELAEAGVAQRGQAAPAVPGPPISCGTGPA
jgi:CheY-like chemotaxis protein